MPAGDSFTPLPTRPYDRDDDLIASVRLSGGLCMRVIRWGDPAVVIGRGGHQDLELDTAAIAADGVPLLLRPGGGCSVVLDPGNLVVSAAVALPGIGEITRAFGALSAWMIAGLDRCGFPGVEQLGVSDLVLSGRKIGGSCIYRTRGLLYYSTTLLVDPDLDLVERYLPHPPREPDYRKGRKHRDFMGSLRSLDPGIDPAKLAAALETDLGKNPPQI